MKPALNNYRRHRRVFPTSRDPEIEAIVAEMRARRDLSIRRIAATAGIHQNTVSNLDRGITRSPMHRTMSRIWYSLGYRLRPMPIGGEE